MIQIHSDMQQMQELVETAKILANLAKTANN